MRRKQREDQITLPGLFFCLRQNTRSIELSFIPLFGCQSHLVYKRFWLENLLLGVKEELRGVLDHQIRLCSPLWHWVWNLYLYEQVCQKNSLMLLSSRRGGRGESSLSLTLTLKLHTSPLLRISADTIFVTAQHEPTNGIIGVNRKGQVPWSNILRWKQLLSSSTTGAFRVNGWGKCGALHPRHSQQQWPGTPHGSQVT